MNSTVDRIKHFIDLKGISVRKFEETVGFSNGSFASQYKNNKTIGVDKVENILRFYPEINSEWLLTGNGEILKTKSTEKATIENGGIKGGENGGNQKVKKTPPFGSNILSIAEPHSEYGKVMRKLKFADGIDIADSGAPFYDLPVSAGKVDELLDIEENPSGFLSLPGISCDAYFPIIGCSFEPYIRAGDIIGINFINRWENLDPDCIYLIITYDQRMMKRLMGHPTDDTLLICISPNLKEFNIDKFTIRYIHKVTFCGRPV